MMLYLTLIPIIAVVLNAGGIESLSSDFKAPVERVLTTLESKGWKPRVAEGKRTAEEQAEKVRKGVSKTNDSKHLCGLAADIIDRRYGWEGLAADKDYQFWKDLGEAAKAEGLLWGGDWKDFRDVAHVESKSQCAPD